MYSWGLRFLKILLKIGLSQSIVKIKNKKTKILIKMKKNFWKKLIIGKETCKSILA